MIYDDSQHLNSLIKLVDFFKRHLQKNS